MSNTDRSSKGLLEIPRGPQFLPFDPHGELNIYVNHLPHWRQEGAAYFVTARLRDSIPAGVLAEWEEESQRWYRAHGIEPNWRSIAPTRFEEAYQRIPEPIRLAFERDLVRQLDVELDHCHGSCVLRAAENRLLLANSLEYFHGSRLWMGDYTIMPNHFHALIVPFPAFELENLLGSIKKWTGRRIPHDLDHSMDRPDSNKRRRSAGLWQHESFDHLVRDGDELHKNRRYIANNGEKANLPADQYTYRAAPWLDRFAERPPSPTGF